MRAQEFLRRYQPSVTEGITVKTIHDLADRKGIAWDDEPSFLKLTKRITGKSHLDDLTPAELRLMRDHLNKQRRTQ